MRKIKEGDFVVGISDRYGITNKKAGVMYVGRTNEYHAYVEVDPAFFPSGLFCVQPRYFKHAKTADVINHIDNQLRKLRGDRV